MQIQSESPQLWRIAEHKCREQNSYYDRKNIQKQNKLVMTKTTL